MCDIARPRWALGDEADRWLSRSQERRCPRCRAFSEEKQQRETAAEEARTTTNERQPKRETARQGTRCRRQRARPVPPPALAPRENTCIRTAQFASECVATARRKRWRSRGDV